MGPQTHLGSIWYHLEPSDDFNKQESGPAFLETRYSHWALEFIYLRNFYFTLPKNKSLCPKNWGGIGLNGIQLK